MHIKISEVIFLLMVLMWILHRFADVLTNANNTVIGNRAFSSDAGVAAQMVSSAVTGLQETGVSACLKHFPGHGDTAGFSYRRGADGPDKGGDGSRGIFTVSVWHRSRCRYDYGRAYHSTEPDRWRFASCEYFRKKSLQECCATVGYQGIIITDAMNMGAITEYYSSDVAAIMALKASADIVLMPEILKRHIRAFWMPL